MPQTKRELSVSSAKRIKTFVGKFIRSEHVEYLTSDRDSDFINRPERAERCYDAAESGSDGKTHSEVISDWRDAFKYWMQARRRGKWTSDPDRFENAVNEYFDSVEAYHETAGTLFQEIG